MMKQDSATATATATTTVIVCGNCGVEERTLLHHVRHRGIFRRLCTTCVLRLHPQSFCPICFLVYDRSPPDDAVTCFKCYSSTHTNCVAVPTPTKTPYICPSCVNPNLPIFTLKKVKDDEGENENCRSIEKKAAGVLLAAARIAAVSMNKAAVAARVEAEKRAKEAAFARKRAREALELVASLMAKGKKNHKVSNTNSSAMAVTVDHRIGNHGVDRVDSSSEVLAALNAVELKEKERLQGSEAQNAPSEALSNVVAMEAEDNERLGISHVSNNENERTGDSGNLDNNNAEGEKVSNGLLSVLVDHPQHMESSHAMEDNIGSQQYRVVS